MDLIFLTLRWLLPPTKLTVHCNMFNSNHNRLQFIVEHETNHCISFLDLSLIKTGGQAN